MNDKPNVTVIYQDAKQASTMGCLEMAVSLIALIVIGIALAGYSLW